MNTGQINGYTESTFTSDDSFNLHYQKVTPLNMDIIKPYQNCPESMYDSDILDKQMENMDELQQKMNFYITGNQELISPFNNHFPAFGLSLTPCLSQPYLHNQPKKQLQSSQPLELILDTPDQSPKQKILQKSSQENIEKKVQCNCKRTQCQKQYCDCFQAGVPCNALCNCQNCENQHVKSNPVRKKPRYSGCTCKKSGCQKNYCECYQMGKGCGDKCKCTDCKNKDALDAIPSPKKHVCK